MVAVSLFCLKNVYHFCVFNIETTSHQELPRTVDRRMWPLFLTNITSTGYLIQGCKQRLVYNENAKYQGYLSFCLHFNFSFMRKLDHNNFLTKATSTMYVGQNQYKNLLDMDSTKTEKKSSFKMFLQASLVGQKNMLLFCCLSNPS